VFIYAARRADGALTVIVINLSLKAKTKVIPIEKQAQVQAESWLFDPDHKAENIQQHYHPIAINNAYFLPKRVRVKKMQEDANVRRGSPADFLREALIDSGLEL